VEGVHVEPAEASVDPAWPVFWTIRSSRLSEGFVLARPFRVRAVALEQRDDVDDVLVGLDVLMPER